MSSAADNFLLDHLRDIMSLAPDGAPDTVGAAHPPPVAPDADWEERLRIHGKTLGIHFGEWSLTIDEAVGICGPGVPLIRPFGDGWAVLRGFRGGAVRVTLVGAQGLSQRRVSLRKLPALLGLAVAQSSAWLVAEPLHPLAAAAHHGHGDDAHLPPLRRLFGLLKPERPDLLLVLAFAFGVGLLGLATPVAVQALVNTVAMGGVFQPVVVLAILLFIFLSFSGAIHVMQSYLVELVQRRIFVRVAADLAYRLPHVRCEIYDRNHGAELVNRFFDVLTVQKAGATLLLEGVATVLQAIIGLVVLAFYHPVLLAFDVMLLISIVFVVFVLGRNAVPTAIAESRAKYAVVAWLEEIARNMLTFKLNRGPALARARADALAHTYLAARSSHFRVLIRQVIGAVSLHAIAGTSLLAIGGLLVVDQQLSVGQLVAAELIVSAVLSSFAKFGKQLESFYDLMAGVDKLGHLIDLPLEREHGEAYPERGAAGASVHLVEVSFAYEHGPTVLAKVTAAIAPGERVAILGPHGAGKSTLADLLCGLRQPTSGRIEFNGLDLRDIRLEALRERIAVVGRVEIVEDTIVENVRVGREDMSLDRVVEVLRALGLESEFADLPDGLNTSIGPNGAPLSSGQARGLMLARAVAGRPMVLIIDGLLDDLDAASRARAAQVVFSEEHSGTVLVLTRSENVARLCQRTVRLAPARPATGSATEAGGS
ncbi:peptidase domain-containing ABC transporter [Methylotetracoccus oryzae]|uniref:peptidase domain-containing ABC transporter n=1 Tax=Methylotetracoccus oryzae TaxID=1919059 RepID=UPI0019124CFF|nr:ATP-binding cassette domain-containing protein [Methylotetracoccus oryzae]